MLLHEAIYTRGSKIYPDKVVLSRDIPDPIKRAIRKACGFGCVCCGLAISAYEHIDPEFHEATEHDPEKMALLCANCHDRVTRKIWSKEKVKLARKNPMTYKKSTCRDVFDISAESPEIWIGMMKFVSIPTSILVNGMPLLRIDKPESPDEPYRISANFYDGQGSLILSIDRNEWVADTNAWDLEAKGRRIVVRSKPRDIVLQIASLPPKGFVVERLKTRLGNAIVNVENGLLQIDSGPKVTMGGFQISGDGPNGAVVEIKDGSVRVGKGHTVMRSLQPAEVPPSIPATSFKVARNEQCPCGSGFKYKMCCGR